MNVDNNEEDGDEGDKRNQEDEEGISEDSQARLVKELHLHFFVSVV